MKVAVTLPTRGLVFTEVEQALENQRKDYDLQIFRSWDLTIPDSLNMLTAKALRESDAKYFLFIEEDTVIPEGGLNLLYQEMYINKADITCIDYGVNGYSCVARNKKTQEILWCGLGCTLVKRNVLEKMEPPWFRTDKLLRLNDWEWIDNPSKSAYGGQDIWFCMKARELGYTISEVTLVKCKHLRLDSLGSPEVNLGLHTISEKTPIHTQQQIDVPEKENMKIIQGHTVFL